MKSKMELPSYGLVNQNGIKREMPLKFMERKLKLKCMQHTNGFCFGSSQQYSKKK